MTSSTEASRQAAEPGVPGVDLPLTDLEDVSTLSRRRMLFAAAPALAVAGAAGFALVRPDDAFATTTDVLIDKGGAVFNVKGYGAVGNGVTDDTTAIINTLAAANAAGGGTVYLPQGSYLVSAKITFPGNGINIVGAGQANTRILVSSSYLTNDVFVSQNRTSNSIRQLTIDAQTNRTGGSAIVVLGQKSDSEQARFYVQDVAFNGQYVGIYVGDAPVANQDGHFGAWLVWIDRQQHTNITAGGAGIVINSPNGGDHFMSNIHIAGPTIVGTGTNQPLAGIQIQGTGGYYIDAVDIVQCQNGLYINPGSGEIVSAGYMTNCLWDTCSNNGITILGPTNNGWVNQLSFTNCWSCNSQTGNGCYIGGPNVERIQFVNHRFYLNHDNGLYVNGGGTQRVWVDASEASGNGTGGSGAKSGFYFASSTPDFAVRGCRALGYYWARNQPPPGTQVNGIRVDSGCNYYVLTSNFVVGNISTGLIDNGGTTKVVANNLV